MEVRKGEEAKGEGGDANENSARQNKAEFWHRTSKA
jgi:hypothetical protein